MCDEEEIGVLHSGKIFWYSRKRIVADREEKHSEVEERDTDVVLQIKEYHAHRGKGKKDHQLSPTEGDPLHPISPTQARLCVEPMTPCASLRSEVR
jgi:hypothetical protein